MTTKPFFYIIQHISSQKYYAGVKYSNADSSAFMTENGYKTSSNIIKQIIIEEGLQSFIIRRIRHFETKEESRDYEARFLRKVKARTNEKFFNRSENCSEFTNKGGYKLSEETKRKISKPKSEETRKKMSKPQTPEFVEKRISKIRGLKRTEKARKNMSDAQRELFKDNDELKLKISNSVKRYFEENGYPESAREKHRELSKGENNPMFGKKHSEETRKKMKEIWARRKAARNESK